ncbi:MAG: hypothetical protein IPN69_13900 [Acidobacteria bacterium]|nr:hypothetical protein [Acidobacteriota bacterium]
MKICPNCQREFPDTMRFCQTDGTPLGEAVEDVQAVDPLKTQIVRQDEIAAMIPPDDPFKTMVASRIDVKEDDEDDVLQIPQDFDPMATMVVAPLGAPEKQTLEDLVSDPPAFDSLKEEIKPDVPAVFFDAPIAPPISEPPAPVFSEPVIEAPSFSDVPAPAPADDEVPVTIFQSNFDSQSPQEPEVASPFSTPPPSFDAPLSEPIAPPPFEAPQAPISSQPSSPFSTPPPSFDAPLSEPIAPPPFEAPQAPISSQPSSPFSTPPPRFDAPVSEPVAPPPFEAPQAPMASEPSSPFSTPPTSFDPPVSQPIAPSPFQPTPFDAPQAPANQAFQPAEWNAPPAPVGEWGQQGIGADTPFQPPAVSGPSQMLAIISLITGVLGFLLMFGGIVPIVSLICIPVSFLLAISGIITGFLARSRAANDPEHYAGSGLALGGIIGGGGAILVFVGLLILGFLLGFMLR